MAAAEVIVPPANAEIPLPVPIEPKIKCRWWTGKPVLDAALYKIDCGEYDMRKGPEVNVELKQKILQTFKDVGLVYLTNTKLGDDIEPLNPYIELVCGQKMIYNGGANPRNNITKSFYEVGAPAVADLHYHHEMAYVTYSTSALAFAARYATDGKGATYVSWNQGVTDQLMKTELGQKLKEKGICYVRRLTDREEYKDDQSMIYNHWQKSFLVETPEEAVEKCREQNLKTEWSVDPRGKKRYLITKYFTSAFEYCPITDRNMIYASIADDANWFDTWPGINHIPAEDRDLTLLFGDETELTDEERQLWVDAYDNNGIPIEWKQGDLALVCNYRFAHGRPGYVLDGDDKRELGVVLGTTFEKVGDLPDKW